MLAEYLRGWNLTTPERVPELLLSVCAGLIGVMMGVAYLLVEAPEVNWLIVPAAYIALMVSGGFLLIQSAKSQLSWLVMLYAAVTAAAMVILAENVVWWVALVGVALLPLVMQSLAALDARTGLFYPVILLVGAGVSLFSSDALEGRLDSVLLGAGVFLIGWAVSANPKPVHKPKVVKSNLEQIQEMPAVEMVFSPEDIAELSTRIHVTADGLVRSTEAITDVTSQQAQGSSELAQLLRQTNVLMDEFLTLTDRVRERGHNVTRTAQQAAEVSGQGQLAIREAITVMVGIREQVEAIASTITTLAQLTRRIDQIINSVSEIATQSNLLALNASIEAARAGIHGRGFAIVADEVRSLSQQSTAAAQQVQAILVEIQDAVRKTIEATEAGMHQVDAGVSQTQEADQIMSRISDDVEVANAAVREIYDVIRQQAEGLEEISMNISLIDRITQQNVTSTLMVETVITNLNRLADDLQSAVQTGRSTVELPSVSALEDI